MAALASFCLRGAAQGALAGAVVFWATAKEGDGSEDALLGGFGGAFIGLVCRLATAALFHVAGIYGLAGTLGGIAISAVIAGGIFRGKEISFLELGSEVVIVGLVSEIGIGYGLVGLAGLAQQRAIPVFV